LPTERYNTIRLSFSAARLVICNESNTRGDGGGERFVREVRQCRRILSKTVSENVVKTRPGRALERNDYNILRTPVRN